MEHLYKKLLRYSGTDIYPYHMPGHKRQRWGELPEALYKTDITEIEGFDNLHQPEEVLYQLQKEAAGLYGAEESFYLVNGSTCGILAAVSCAVPFGGCLLMGRNCHKAAYHAVYLRHLEAHYLYPPYLEPYGILDAVSPEQVGLALEKAREVQAVLIVSPTYEGRISDIAAIADIVHERGIPLIVDEAHGAHLGLAEGFPMNSCQAGADLVIHSVHKTLPALTQTALLHVNGKLVDRDRLRRFLRIYQTSSPSYPLMAGIDNCLEYVKRQGREAFGQFRKRYGNMLESLSKMEKLTVLSGESREQDIGKLLIFSREAGITGKKLADILLEEYHLQVEMAAKDFVLAMFTVNDGEEAYRRMEEALLEIDSKLEGRKSGEKQSVRAEGMPDEMSHSEHWGRSLTEERAAKLPEDHLREGMISLAKAWDMENREISLEDSIGEYVAEFVNLYPPGIPLLVPGERMTEDLYSEIMEDLDIGLNVQGIRIAQREGLKNRCYYLKVLECRWNQV